MDKSIKKVLFHIHSLSRGGAERVMSVLINDFAADGIEVVLVTLWRDKVEYPISDKVRRIVLDEQVAGQDNASKVTRAKTVLHRYTGLRKVIKDEKPDIVVTFCNKANFRAAIAMKGIDTPLLVSVRNNPDKDYAPFKRQTKIMEKRANGCVFQTEDAAKFFSERLIKQSRTIWNPIDEKYLTAQKREINDKTVKRIVTAGRISAQKNQLMLVKAFNRIKEQYPQAIIDIYGGDFKDGSKEKIEQYIKDNNLTSKVHFAGLSGQIEKDIRDAYMFVLPSDYEGMPNALIEAMALGIPVISTDCPCGGPKSIIEDGKNGYLVPVGDDEAMAKAMTELLADEKKADQIGAEATKIIESVKTDTICTQWKEYIQELIKNQ